MTGQQKGGSAPALLARDLRGIRLERAFRMQVFTGNSLVAIAIYLFLPIPAPSLWLLDDWGGLELPPFTFPIIFIILGMILSMTRRVFLAMHGMMLAFVMVATIGAAAYLALGLNVVPVICLVWLWHIGQTVVDLKGILREVQAGRLPDLDPDGGPQ